MQPHVQHLYLLTTLGCSLCHKAKQPLWPLLSSRPLKLVEVELTDYPELMAHYAAKIPVLTLSPPELLTADSPVLQWPFCQAEVQGWLEQS